MILKCQEIYHRGEALNKCKRDLVFAEELCGVTGSECKAQYAENWNDFTVCSGSCIKRLDVLTNIEKRKRSKKCRSDEAQCKEEDGEDEIKFCDDLTVCPLQPRDQTTLALLGT